MKNLASSSVQNCVAKIGTNAIADGIHINEQIQFNIAREIIEQRMHGIWTSLFSSGAVALGEAEFNGHGFLDKDAAIRLYSTIGQKRLMRSWENAFLRAGQDLGIDKRIHTSEGILIRRDFESNDAITNLRAVMREAKHIESTGYDLIFFVENGNDLIAKDHIKNDNDLLASDFARAISAKAFFLLSDVDGLYTGNPRHSNTHLVTDVYVDTRVPIEEASEFAYVTQDKSKNGRGGIDTKLRAIHSYLSEIEDGIAYIGNGTVEGIMQLLAKREKGSRFTTHNH